MKYHVTSSVPSHVIIYESHTHYPVDIEVLEREVIGFVWSNISYRLLVC